MILCCTVSSRKIVFAKKFAFVKVEKELPLLGPFNQVVNVILQEGTIYMRSYSAV